MARRSGAATAMLACIASLACLVSGQVLVSRGTSIATTETISCGVMSGPVNLDGNITAGEWAGATVVNITLTIGSTSYPTSLYFMNDHATFYFAMTIRGWYLQLLDTLYLMFGPAEHEGTRDVDVKMINQNIEYYDRVNQGVVGPMTFQGSVDDGSAGGRQHGAAGIHGQLVTGGPVTWVSSFEVRFPLESGDGADITFTSGQPVEFRLFFGTEGGSSGAFYPAATAPLLFVESIHVDPPPAIDGFVPALLLVALAGAVLKGLAVKKKMNKTIA